MGFDLFVGDESYPALTELPLLIRNKDLYLYPRRLSFPTLEALTSRDGDFDPELVHSEAAQLRILLDDIVRPYYQEAKPLNDCSYESLRCYPLLLWDGAQFIVEWGFMEWQRFLDRHYSTMVTSKALQRAEWQKQSLLAHNNLLHIVPYSHSDLVNGCNWSKVIAVSAKVIEWRGVQVFLDGELRSELPWCLAENQWGSDRISFLAVPVAKAWEKEFTELSQVCEHALRTNQQLVSSL